MNAPTMDRLNAALSGRYAIDREIGSGGMATVYLAHDVRHDRGVALKVLRPELAAVMGAERFLSEIRTTANLQHPHILALFDSGEADGFLFYVMPYVEGETLRDLIDRERQLPVEQVVAIVTKIAHALDSAHRQGVVHRDIKPSNILLHDGEPVLADFGIALAVQEAGGGRMTETGLSLGTPFYMSPEQATGDRLPDGRSDVYSLGSVLYEMLTGEPPFQGASAQSVLAKILTGDIVAPTQVRKSLPPNVTVSTMCALERLPADRFATAGELADALADPGFRHGEQIAGTALSGGGFWKPLALVSSAATLVLAALLALPGQPAESPASWLRLTISVPDSFPVVNPPSGSAVQISADGSTIAYLGLQGGERRIFVRRRGDLEARPIGSTGDAEGFFLSPTGDEVAFYTGDGQALRAASAATGVVRTLVPAARLYSGDWTSEGWVYFENPSAGISRVPSAGGAVQVMSVREGRLTDHTLAHPRPTQ